MTETITTTSPDQCHQSQATVTDSEGLTGTESMTVVVGEPFSLEMDPESGEWVVGDTIQVNSRIGWVAGVDVFMEPRVLQLPGIINIMLSLFRSSVPSRFLSFRGFNPEFPFAWLRVVLLHAITTEQFNLTRAKASTVPDTITWESQIEHCTTNR